jgi:predicted glycosyltransferase
MDLSVGQIVSLKATVKKHENYTPKFAGAVTYAQTILTRCALVTRATVVSSEVVEKEEEKVIPLTAEQIEENNRHYDQTKVYHYPAIVTVKVKYNHYHLVGADGRKYVLISKSKKKGLTTGVTAQVEYAVEDLSSYNNGSRPVSFVTVI